MGSELDQSTDYHIKSSQSPFIVWLLIIVIAKHEVLWQSPDLGDHRVVSLLVMTK